MSKKTLVIRNGTLIDGSGNPAGRNDAIVIEGNRIKSVGALPPAEVAVRWAGVNSGLAGAASAAAGRQANRIKAVRRMDFPPKDCAGR